MTKPTVSLNLIVRNEEKNIAACLECCRGLADEIVVVDTGSTDRTVQIAESMDAIIWFSPWQSNFSAVRNFAIEHSTSDWILWLDADDRIDSENHAKIRALIDRLPEKDNVGYFFRVHCSLPAGQPAVITDHVRLFRRLPGVRWQRRVHEVISRSIIGTGGHLVLTDIRVDHLGYADEASRLAKIERNAPLYRLDLAERPDDPDMLYDCAKASAEAGKSTEAIGMLQSALRLVDSTMLLRAYVCSLMAQLAVEPESASAETVDPLHPELLYAVGVVLHDAGCAREAVQIFEKILGTREWPPSLGSIDPATTGYRTQYRLAVSLMALSETERAGAILDSLLTDNPWHYLAQFTRAKLAVERCEHDTADRLIATLAEGGRHVDAHYLRGLLAEKRGLEAQALGEYHAVLAIMPTHTWAKERIEALTK